jgi:hypothetical protein
VTESIFLNHTSYVLQGYRLYHAKGTMQKTLVFNGIFIFKMDLLLMISRMGLIKALYMDPTENTPFLASPEKNSSAPGTN